MLSHPEPPQRADSSLPLVTRCPLCPAGFHPSNPGYRLQVLEQSCVAETMVLSMATLEDQPAVRLLVLHTLQMMTSTSGEHTHTRARTHAQEYTHTYTHAHTHTQEYTRTHTSIHIHTWTQASKQHTQKSHTPRHTHTLNHIFQCL